MPLNRVLWKTCLVSGVESSFSAWVKCVGAGRDYTDHWRAGGEGQGAADTLWGTGLHLPSSYGWDAPAVAGLRGAILVPPLGHSLPPSHPSFTTASYQTNLISLSEEIICLDEKSNYADVIYSDFA